MNKGISIIGFCLFYLFCSDDLNAQINPVSGIYDIPNVFTPNGDLQNDVIDFSFLNLTEIIITIYNRWGEKVFESSRTNTSWVGKNKNGVDCPAGVYYYAFDYADFINKKIDRKGFIQLLR
ncbi:MAG: gliding motility-associated C-terminal domain-containing protein [Bacteroidota bacterium]|nr:gliding motility-associated C-terminal domain-containing protein [Bacteroidota bacterium]